MSATAFLLTTSLSAVFAASVVTVNRPGLCVIESSSAASALQQIPSGVVHGVFGHVVVQQCSGGEVAPLTVLEFVPVGNRTDAKAWTETVSAKVDVVYSSVGRVIARSLSDAVVASLPVQTEVIPVLDGPMRAFDMSSEAAAILNATMNKLKTRGADPIIERMIGDITPDRIRESINYLTGVTSSIRSRNSIHPDGVVAANWMKAEFEKYGFTVELESFRTGWFPNVIATLKGVEFPDKVVVVGAHLDSRGRASQSATDPAPGANDDGSGAQTLLQIARVISEYNADFKYTIVLGAWGGEEQGLVGSRAYAQKCKANDVDIIAMIQADMIAFRGRDEGIQCGFPNRYASEILTDLGMSILRIYTPQIETCYTPACCSDHQSFYEQGYAATQYFERCGGIIDDKYHDAGDIVDRPGYDLTGQMTLITKGYAATALTLAEFNG